MQGSTSGPRRVFAALGIAAALMAVGAGIAAAVGNGTEGELNYQRETFTLVGTTPGMVQFDQRKVKCIDGRHVTGGGSENLDTQGGAFDGRPYDGPDGDKVPDDGWMVDTSIYGENTGRVAVYAICDD
jgi:hypothetical protein